MSDDMKAPERIWIDDERPYGGECHFFTEANVVPGIPLSVYGVEYIRADRIQKLERERDEEGINHLAWKLEAEATQANLIKAVEALRSVEDEYTDIQWGPELQSIKQVRTVLAELEGKDE